MDRTMTVTTVVKKSLFLPPNNKYMMQMSTKDSNGLSPFVLASSLKSLQKCDWETFFNRLQKFQETHLGQTLQRCIKESIHLKETERNIVLKTILENFFKVCEKKNTKTFLEKEKEKTRELVEAVTLLVAVFLIVLSFIL
jgi:hypothetical protein